MSLIWNLPKVRFTSLTDIEETRPVAVITTPDVWNKVGDSLDLPIVVQSEPDANNLAQFNIMANNVPSTVQAIYVVGTGIPVTAGKIVAQANNLPLIIVPDALESDALFEAHVFLPKDGKLNRIETGPAEWVLLDWDYIQEAPQAHRTAAIVDVLAIVTALLDWRYAARLGKNPPEEKFSAWGASVAASLASQAIKSASSIGEGTPEGLRTLLDLLMMSVQLAGQLGHDRHQEGTEHYFAFSLENQGVTAPHAETVGAGILFASALHGQDPASLRDALTNVGINVDTLQSRDIKRAIGDLADFCEANELPFGRSHNLDPFSDAVGEALEIAGILHTDKAEIAEPDVDPELEELAAFEVNAAPVVEPAPTSEDTGGADTLFTEVTEALGEAADEQSTGDGEAPQGDANAAEDNLFAEMTEALEEETSDAPGPDETNEAESTDELDFATLLDPHDVNGDGVFDAQDVNDFFNNLETSTPDEMSSMPDVTTTEIDVQGMLEEMDLDAELDLGLDDDLSDLFGDLDDTGSGSTPGQMMPPPQSSGYDTPFVDREDDITPDID